MTRYLTNFLWSVILIGVASCVKIDPEDPSAGQMLTGNTWKLYEITGGTNSYGLLDTEWKFSNDSTLLITFPSGGTMNASWQNTNDKKIRIALPFRLPDGTPDWKYIYTDIVVLNINRLELKETVGSLNAGMSIIDYRYRRK